MIELDHMLIADILSTRCPPKRASCVQAIRGEHIVLTENRVAHDNGASVPVITLPDATKENPQC